MNEIFIIFFFQLNFHSSLFVCLFTFLLIIIEIHLFYLFLFLNFCNGKRKNMNFWKINLRLNRKQKEFGLCCPVLTRENFSSGKPYSLLSPPWRKFLIINCLRSQFFYFLSKYSYSLLFHKFPFYNFNFQKNSRKSTKFVYKLTKFTKSHLLFAVGADFCRAAWFKLSPRYK